MRGYDCTLVQRVVNLSIRKGICIALCMLCMNLTMATDNGPFNNNNNNNVYTRTHIYVHAMHSICMYMCGLHGQQTNEPTLKNHNIYLMHKLHNQTIFPPALPESHRGLVTHPPQCCLACRQFAARSAYQSSYARSAVKHTALVICP